MFFPGFLIDSKDRFVAVVAAADAVGVCTTRFPSMPSLSRVISATTEELWVMLKRGEGDKIYLSEPRVSLRSAELVLQTPDCKESLHMAIEVGLGLWPEWCPDLRQEGSDFHPRTFVPLPKEDAGINA